MKQRLRVAVSGVVLLGALILLQFRSTGDAVPVRKSFDTFPITLGNWQGREATIFEVEILNVLKVSDYLMRRYVDPAGRSLWLYMGYWETQRKGAQPHSPKNCLPGAGWEPLEATRVTVPMPSLNARITVNRFLIQKGRDQQLVFYWYHAQGRPIAGEVAARIETVKSAIVRNRTDGALIRISSPVYGSVPETSERLVRYIQWIYPILHEYLPE